MRRSSSAALLVTACGDDDAETADTSDRQCSRRHCTRRHANPRGTWRRRSGGDCATGITLDDGTLTVATGEPAFPPWVIDDAPESGEGFEAAVAYAVAA